jgi:hypothetical protein
LFTQEIYAKEKTFGISSSRTLREDHEARHKSRHAMNMTPNDLRTEASTCKSSGTQPENSEACIARIQALTMKETTSKAHMQVHTNKGSREKQPGKKPGPNRAEKGLGRPAQPTPGPVRVPLLPQVLVYLLPLPPPDATSIHSSENRRDEGEAPGGSRRPPRVLELPRRWLRPCSSRHGWPCVVKPWWSSAAAT